MLLGDRITDEQRLPLSRAIEYIHTHTMRFRPHESPLLVAAACRMGIVTTHYSNVNCFTTIFWRT
jgi:hypothetical protein